MLFFGQGNMSEAVDCYLSTKDLLRRYQHLSSLSAVQSDCENALVKLKDALHATIAQVCCTRHLPVTIFILFYIFYF